MATPVDQMSIEQLLASLRKDRPVWLAEVVDLEALLQVELPQMALEAQRYLDARAEFHRRVSRRRDS